MSVTIGITVLEFLLVSAGSFLLLRHYQSPSVTLDVSFTVYLSWVLGFATVLLLPYDLSIAITENVQSSSLFTMWKIVYWSTFFLAWVVLPIQLDFHSSGFFTAKEKFLDACWKQVYSFLLISLLALVFFIYMLSTSSLTFSQLIAFTMAMGNTYGLLLLTALLGSGLVALPKRLYEQSDLHQELYRLYVQSVAIEDSCQDAKYALEDVENDVDDLYAQLTQGHNASTHVHSTVKNNTTNSTNNSWFGNIFNNNNSTNNSSNNSSSSSSESSLNKELLLAYSKEITLLHEKKERFQQQSQQRGGTTSNISHLYNSVNKSNNSHNNNNKPRKSYDKHGIVALHSRLMLSHIKATAAEQRWRQHILTIQHLETRLNGQPLGGTHTADNKNSNNVSTNSNNSSNSTCTCMHTLYEKHKSQILKGLALLCALLSIIVLWSEMVLATSLPSIPGLLMGCSYDTCHHTTGNTNKATNNAGDDQHVTSYQVLIQSVAFLFLAYLSTCTYLTLFRINLGGYYRLQAPQLSPHTSLLINAQYISRLQFSIGYNFLVFLHATPATEYSSFMQLMQHMDVLPVFGTSLLYFVPVFLVLFVLMSWYDGLGRLLKWLGVETEESILIASSSTTAHSATNATTNTNRSSSNSSVKISANSQQGNVNSSEMAEKYQQGRQVVLAEVKRSQRSSFSSTNKHTNNISNNNNNSSTTATNSIHNTDVSLHNNNTDSGYVAPKWSSYLPSFLSSSTTATIATNSSTVNNSHTNSANNNVSNNGINVLPKLSVVSTSSSNNKYSRLGGDIENSPTLNVHNRISNSNNSYYSNFNQRIDEDEEEIVELPAVVRNPLGNMGLNSTGFSKNNVPPPSIPQQQQQRPAARDLFSLLDDDDEDMKKHSRYN